MTGLAIAESSSSDRDVTLVQSMARGDASALAELYEQHAGLLTALVRRIVADREAAEDIVHDVFLEAWRHAEDYDETRASVRTWLALRARSRALDHRKSSAVARRVSFDGVTEREAPAAEDLTLAPDRSRVQNALRTLPEEQLRVLALGYFEGLSSSEIAERVGVPVGTVKSRVAAALARLRAVLRGREGA